MAENCRAQRTGDEAYCIHRECLEHAYERVGIGKEQLTEDQSRDGAVEKKIVPFDGSTDRTGDDGSAQLAAMGKLAQRARQNVGHCHG